MRYGSVIELSEGALRRNVRFFRQVAPGARFCSVIKGNAYGHGIHNMVPLLERCGVRRFAVFSADEAVEAVAARQADSDVVIMGDVDGERLEWAVEHGVGMFVFDRHRLRGALAAARQVGRPARVHLELETGLHRTGLEQGELPDVVELLAANPEHLHVDGVCTHLAGAESVGNYFRIQHQLERFDALTGALATDGVPLGLRHAACSAAAISYPKAVMDMVRVGIGQYGFWPSQETRMDYFIHRRGREDLKRVADPLRRVMRWRSRIMSFKRVPAGEFVGYGTSYLTQRPVRLAHVPVGYFHGFARSLSNLGHVLVRGRRARVVGTVNMNMMTIDVTDIAGVERGDEVVIIGRQRKAHMTVASFSDLTQFLNYEVLVRLPREIPRVVVA